MWNTWGKADQPSVAVACIRGGGEYGKDWHDCAVGLNRYICYEDFSHAARYLHSKGLTTPALTASYGISNGGTLVASSMNRDPELWGVVCPDVGVFDLTRFHLFVSLPRFQAVYEAHDCADPWSIMEVGARRSARCKQFTLHSCHVSLASG